MQEGQREKKQPLHWKFDISTFRLLGRELITDRITALFELVKNSYDANAENVFVEFYNVGNNSPLSKIVVRDDGTGMSFKDIKDKWMVVGTNSKREKLYSDPPYNRKFVGEKGLGRFAVDKLGSKVIIKTKKSDSNQITILETNWSEYEKLVEIYDHLDNNINGLDKGNIKKKFFTDLDNNYWFEYKDDKSHGTELTISMINEIWTFYDIQRAERELAKLVSPIKKMGLPFNISIFSNEHLKEYSNKSVKNNAIQFATKEIYLGYDLEKGTQEILYNNKGELGKRNKPISNIGPVEFKLYYFDKTAKAKYKSSYKGESIDGIKIYRDGIIATPFAEYEHQDIKKRDILGIDKRRYSGFFDKVSSSDLIGILEITKEYNPKIIDATNRQDFVDTSEYRKLKEFIISQIEELEASLKDERENAKRKANKDLVTAKNDLSNFTAELRSITAMKPELEQYLAPLEERAKKVIIDFNKGIKAYNELEKEKIRQENIFLSLMSLQDYALEISHVVRTSLSKIIHLAEFFKTEFPNPAYEELFINYAENIYTEMLTLDKAVDFMLSYAGSNTDFTEINLKKLIEELFYNSYKSIFEKNSIHTIVEIDKPVIITHNRKFFEDIIENLISNSIKALQNSENKIIKCTGNVEADRFTLYFSDNGPGIEEEDKMRIFNIYFTKTAAQGGAGIGLFIVKKRIEALKGSVEVVENEFKPTGATFRIILPFKR